MLEAKTIHVDANGESQEFSYFDIGSAASALVCLHGIQGSKSTYDRLLRSEISDHIRIVSVDLPGFGGSADPIDGRYDLSYQSRRLVQFFDTLGLKQIVIFGHSLGGMLATLLLEQIPERVIALINSEGNLKLEDCGESRKVSDMTLDQFTTLRFPEIKSKGTVARPEAFYYTSKSVVEVSQSGHLLEVLQKSTVPVLFIRGGKSHFKTQPSGENIKNVMFEEHTHFTLAKSEELLNAINLYLQDLNLINT
jgi:pimeloyl-ACP methyl ester carboxylesterase